MHDEPESNTIHAAIYARVSTDDQGKGFSIHTQVERCQQYAKEHQMVVWKSHVYIDNGVSGATLDRTALQAMRDVVRSKVVQAVIVYDLDRLTRNLGHQCLLIDEWKKASVQFHTVAHPIDDTPEGQTLRQVLGAFAELEREKIKERSVRGMKERLKSGLPRGTAAPYGYQWTKTPHASTLEINEEEATVVRQIFRWILEGRTLRSIGVQLSREKVLTRRLGQKKTSPWNWSNTSLHRMAHYEGYLGHMYHGKVKGAGKTLEKLPEEGWLEIKIPAIIDQETFDAAAQQLIKNGQTASRRRKRDYLFSASTLRCGQCGNGMNGEAKINRYKPERLIDHIYYRCNTHGRILDGGHCRSTVAAWRLEPLVWSYVERLLSDPAVILESIVVAQYGSLHQRAEVERRLAALDTELAQFDQRDARLIVAYENDIITAEELKERRADHASQKQRLANEHWDLEQALVTLGAPPPEREALKDYLSHVKAQLKTLSNAEKRRVLDTLHIVVTWTTDQPLQVSGSVPSADPGERCPFSDQLVDDLYLTIYE